MRADNGYPPLPQDEREEKLPAWAQKQMDTLRRRTQAAEDAVADARDGEDLDGSDTIFRPYGDIPLGLGTGQTVRFKTAGIDGNKKFSSDYIDIRAMSAGGAIQLMGGRGIVLFPQSSNVVNIRMANPYS